LARIKQTQPRGIAINSCVDVFNASIGGQGARHLGGHLLKPFAIERFPIQGER
jgi:hypothetical protein